MLWVILIKSIKLVYYEDISSTYDAVGEIVGNGRMTKKNGKIHPLRCFLRSIN